MQSRQLICPCLLWAQPIGKFDRGKRGENRHQLLEIRALAGRTRRRVALAREVFEVLAAAAALVFKKRHGVFYAFRNQMSVLPRDPCLFARRS